MISAPRPANAPGFIVLTGLLLAAGACDSRNEMEPTPPDAADAVVGVPGEIALEPGPVIGTDTGRAFVNPYSGDAEAVAEGRRLYTWYNCGACHGALGGGGMGPPLRDGQWIYGGDAVSIYRSIMQGRPEGMPGWIGRIPDDQAWRIVAFVGALASDDFDFEPPLRPPRNRVPEAALGDGALSPTEP